LGASFLAEFEAPKDKVEARKRETRRTIKEERNRGKVALLHKEKGGGKSPSSSVYQRG